MAFLIFCSYEVGGWPYTIADVLNRHGVEAYYVSVPPVGGDPRKHAHDSALFHLGRTDAPWNLSRRVRESARTRRSQLAELARIAREVGISACFATGAAASLLEEGLPCGYSYWSYGADLDSACTWPTRPSDAGPTGPLAWARYLARLARAATRVPASQRSIRAAKAVMIAPYQYRDLRHLSPGKPLFFLPHIIPTEDFATIEAHKMKGREALRRRFGARNVFFSSTRHYWGGPLALMSDNKGNDVALRAFAQYRQTERGKAAKLVLIRKGPSVMASQELARELGLSDHIAWVDSMPRGELAEYYAGADLCLGQFGTSVLTYATLEPMALGTPVASFDDSVHERVPFYSERPVMFNSRDPGALARFMHDVTVNDESPSDLSRRSWQWVRDNCSESRFVAAFTKAVV